MFECRRCGYKNSLKTNFIRHLHRKKICEPTIEDINIREIYKKYFKNEEKEVSQDVAKI